MAYGLRHHIDFNDIGGTAYRIALLCKDWVGMSTSQRAGAAPFIQDIQMDSLYKAIVGSIYEINSVTQGIPSVGLSSFQLEDLFLDDEREYVMEFRCSPEGENKLLYKGWLSGYKTIQPLSGGDWPFTLTASCGLGQLKNEEFKPSDTTKTVYTGRMSYLEIIKECLAKTGLGLPFSIAQTWVALEAGHVNGISPFDLEVEARAYYDDNLEPYDCAKVMEDILQKFNCQVFQENGRYYIIQIEERSRTSFQIKNYTAEGQYVDTTTYSPRKVVTYSGPINLSSATYSAVPPKRRFESTVDKKSSGKNLIYNGDFNERVPALIGLDPFRLADWSVYTSSFLTYQSLLILKPVGIELGPASAFPATDEQRETWMADNDLNFLEAKKIPYSGLSNGFSKAKVTVKYVSYSQSTRLPVCVWGLKLRNSQNGLEAFLQKDGTWTTTRTYESYIPTEDQQTAAVFDGQPIVSFTKDIEFRQGFELISDPFVAKYADELYFYLYRPSASTVDAGQKVIVLETRMEVQANSSVVKVKDKVDNNVSASYENESYTFITGDLDDKYSLAQLYYPNSENWPSWWDTNPSLGMNYKSIFELMLRKRADNYRKHKLSFEGEMYDHLGQVTMLDTVLIDYFPGYTRLYLQLRRRYDFRMRRSESMVLEETLY